MSEQKLFEILDANYKAVQTDGYSETVITLQGIYIVAYFEDDDNFIVNKNKKDYQTFKTIDQVLEYIK